MAKVFSSTGVTTGTYSDRLAVASPYLGQQFYQTDTDELLKYATDLDGTARWMQADHDYNRNLVVNGGFDIWQRATTSTVSSSDYYGPADRWQTVRLSSDTQRTFSRQPVTSSDTPVSGFTYFMRCQRDAATVATNSISMATSFETTSVRRTQNKYVTLSFYARAGTNFSMTSGLRAYIQTGTGTDGRLITGNFTSSATLVDSNNVLTTSWKRFTITTSAAVANTVTQMGINFQFTPVGTAGAADYYDITGVQLETGTAPSDFEQREFGDELRRCQRYFERYESGYPPQNPCNIDVANRPEVILQYQRKRTSPTITVSSSTGFTFESLTSSAGVTVTGYSGTLVGTGVQSANIFFTATAWTAYLPGILIISSSQYIDISAEL
jgi:hypothetical protein